MIAWYCYPCQRFVTSRFHKSAWLWNSECVYSNLTTMGFPRG